MPSKQVFYAYCVKRSHAVFRYSLVEWMDAALNRTPGRRRQEQVWRPTRFSHLPRRVTAINSLLHTHTATGYTASANAWPFSSQSKNSLKFRVYIKNRPFPGCHPRGYTMSLLCVSHTPLWLREKTSNTPDGDTFLIEISEKCGINLAGVTVVFF